METHKGHRERMKQEFLSGGLAHFSESRALELLLFYSRFQGDVNPLAHRLLDTFGSLAGVLDAEPELLQAVPGMGKNSVVLLKLVPSLAAKYLQSRANIDNVLSSSPEIRKLFTPYFFGARNEMAYLACLDAKMKLLGVKKLSEGTPNVADITARRVAEAALCLNSSIVILAHNHTSGIATPSQADLATTEYLRDFLAKMDVLLYDHVIIVDDDMVSLHDSGFL